MTMEALQEDASLIAAKVKTLNPSTTSGELVRLIKGDIWPFIESLVGEVDEIDTVMAEVTNDEADIIQPETAQQFAVVIAGGLGMVAKVRELSLKDASGNILDAELANVLATYEAACAQATATLSEITANPDDPDSDEEDGPFDDSDDADEDDKEGAKS